MTQKRQVNNKPSRWNWFQDNGNEIDFVSVRQSTFIGFHIAEFYFAYMSRIHSLVEFS